jgi:hypothetical protein
MRFNSTEFFFCYLYTIWFFKIDFYKLGAKPFKAKFGNLKDLCPHFTSIDVEFNLFYIYFWMMWHIHVTFKKIKNMWQYVSDNNTIHNILNCIVEHSEYVRFCLVSNVVVITTN